MIASVVVLALLAGGLLAVIVYNERRHEQERGQLLDRIMAPEATRAAAIARAYPETPPAKPDDMPLGDVVPADPDLAFLAGGD